MSRPYGTLAEHPIDMVRLACTKCEGRGQYRKAMLIEHYGPDANIVSVFGRRHEKTLGVHARWCGFLGERAAAASHFGSNRFSLKSVFFQ